MPSPGGCTVRDAARSFRRASHDLQEQTRHPLLQTLRTPAHPANSCTPCELLHTLRTRANPANSREPCELWERGGFPDTGPKVGKPRPEGRECVTGVTIVTRHALKIAKFREITRKCGWWLIHSRRSLDQEHPLRSTQRCDGILVAGG